MTEGKMAREEGLSDERAEMGGELEDQASEDFLIEQEVPEPDLEMDLAKANPLGYDPAGVDLSGYGQAESDAEALAGHDPAEELAVDLEVESELTMQAEAREEAKVGGKTKKEGEKKEKKGEDRDYSYTQNRELSWLNFNKRVLEEALDDSVPLFEKLGFLKIFCTNLDEFCMVRVGKLTDLAMIDADSIDNKSGMTPGQQLTAIFDRIAYLYKYKDTVFQEIEQQFRGEGVYNLSIDELNKAQTKAIYKYFRNMILPILSPTVISYHRPLPFLENRSEYVILKLERKGKEEWGIVPIPKILPKIIKLPTATGYPFIRTSKIIYQFVEECFPKCTILDKTIIRVTRNADLSADDEVIYEEVDYRDLMKKILKKRNRLQAVRVEVNEKSVDGFLDFLCSELGIRASQIIQSDAPLSMDYVSELKDYLDHDFINQHSYSRWLPRLGERAGFSGDLIDRVKEQDRFFIYPYDSMDSYLNLIDQAARDDRVVSIKITIYRLASNSRLVDSLCRAAENGKEVLVLMELRARFDEQSNLDYSKQLFDAGCDIIYGMGGFKAHSKCTLITLKDKEGWSYITQIGTGNYNEQTAKAYSDFSLMTADPEIGEDAVEFFKNLQRGNLDGEYKQLIQSPSSLKPTLLRLMDQEIAKGPEGYLFFKMNSLTDRDFIDKLHEASMAGCQVKLIIRGISCLVPGLPGSTDHIEIHSIVGRFLEHARVYIFGQAQETIYIGSADLMTRNTEHRVEILTPVKDAEIRKEIIRFMDLQFSDNVKGRRFGTDGDMHKIEDGQVKVNAQESMLEEASKERPTKTGSVQKISFWTRVKNFFTGEKA